MRRSVTWSAQYWLGILTLFAAANTISASTASAAESTTAIATGNCATAINAGDYARITVTCGLTARERNLIDRLDARYRTLYNSQQALRRNDLQQTQSQLTHTSELASLKAQLEDTKAVLAGVLIQVNKLAAGPNASTEARHAALALADGEVDPAIRLLGQRASEAQRASAPDSRAASELYVQQAALLLTRDLSAAEEATEKALQLDPQSSTALAMSAQLAYAKADYATAIRQQQKVYDGAAARLAATPGNTVIQQEVAVARGALGWIRLMSGELVQSRADLTASLEGFERLVALDPTNPEWRRLQSVGYATQSDGQLAAGDFQAALASLRRSLDIAKELSDRIGSPAARYEVVGRLEKIGYVQGVMNQPVQASASLKSALEQLEPIIAANPEVDSGYSDQVNILGQLAWLQLASGEVGMAIETYRKAVQIGESRLHLAPLSPYWQRWVEILNGGLGDALMAQPAMSLQDIAQISQAAEAGSVRARSLAEALAMQNPQNQMWQSDLWIANSRLAKIKVAQGKLQEALALYNQGLVLLEPMVSHNDANAALHNALGAGYALKADTLARQGNRSESFAMFGEAIGQLKRAVELAPGIAQFERDLASATLTRGQLTYMSSPSQALPDLQDAVRMRKTLLALQPANGLWEAETIFAQLTLASAQGSRDDRITTLKSARELLLAHTQANRAPPFPSGTLESIDSQIATMTQAP